MMTDAKTSLKILQDLTTKIRDDVVMATKTPLTLMMDVAGAYGGLILTKPVVCDLVNIGAIYWRTLLDGRPSAGTADDRLTIALMCAAHGVTRT